MKLVTFCLLILCLSCKTRTLSGGKFGDTSTSKGMLYLVDGDSFYGTPSDHFELVDTAFFRNDGLYRSKKLRDSLRKIGR